MRTPRHKTPTTRAALAATACRDSRWFATLLAGATVLGAPMALAVNNEWLGTTNSDWNEPTNWSLGRVPANPNGAPEGDTFDDAVINIATETPPFPILATDPPANPRDIYLGFGVGQTGRFDMRAGTITTGGWMFFGRLGGTATFNLADTSATGGTLTEYGEGTGSLSVGRLYLGAWDGAGTSAVANVNTTGALTIADTLQVGSGGGNATLNIDAGTVSTGNWTEFGNGGGSIGNLNMSGGVLTKGGEGNTAIGTNGGTGIGNQSGGIISVNNEFYVGQNGGTGTFNLSGDGVINSAGHTIIGRDGGNGTFTQTGGTMAPVGGELWVGQAGGSVGVYNLSAGEVNVNNWVAIGRNGGTGTFNLTGGTFNKTGNGAFIVGANGKGTMEHSGGTLNTNGSDLWVGEGGTVEDVYNLSGAGVINVGNWVAIGRGGTATMNISGGTLTKTGAGSVTVGNFGGGPGTLNVSGGLLDIQSGNLIAGEGGDQAGTINISGTAQVNTAQVLAGMGGTVVGNLNLDGGTLNTGLIDGAGSGISNVDFNGTQIVATANSPAFIANFDSADVEAGGLKIDTAGMTVGIAQSLTDGGGGGGVVKTGAGRLDINAFNNYTGATMVNAGTLGGTGIVSGAITVAAGADLSPGAPTGVLSADSVNFSGPATMTIHSDASGAGRLDVSNNLNLTNASLAFDGEFTARVYVIASYGTLTGTFTPAPALPSGYTSINYTFEGNKIAISRPATAFDTFIEAAFPDADFDPAILAPTADPDNDGVANSVEFALGGDPADPADGPKVFPLRADSSDGGTAAELLLTIAVRSGTPAFTGSPSPTATTAGYTYTVQGSTDLTTFTTPVTVVDPVTTGLDPAPAGYEYRTFSLSGSDGLPSRGFLRVQVTP
jgi:hypothetical protein